MPALLILASASPRRAELLGAAGVDFEVIAPEVEEIPGVSEPPQAYSQRVARDKARAVAVLHPGRVVLGADTEVVLGGRILGKPRDEDDARRMLAELAGREHMVLTSVCVIGPPGEEVFTVSTRVRIQADPARIAWYAGSGEPPGKAGAYAVQGLGAAIVTEVHGSYTAVVGLPLPETLAALDRAGVRMPWSRT